MERKIKNSAMLAEIKQDYIEKRKCWKRQILVCGGAGCISSHCGEVQDSLKKSLTDHHLESGGRDSGDRLYGNLCRGARSSGGTGWAFSTRP